MDVIRKSGYSDNCEVNYQLNVTFYMWEYKFLEYWFLLSVGGIPLVILLSDSSVVLSSLFMNDTNELKLDAQQFISCIKETLCRMK